MLYDGCLQVCVCSINRKVVPRSLKCSRTVNWGEEGVGAPPPRMVIVWPVPFQQTAWLNTICVKSAFAAVANLHGCGSTKCALGCCIGLHKLRMAIKEVAA